MPQGLLKRFEVLKKCRNKFECLVYEILFIRALKPNLNVQSVRLHSCESIFIIFAPSYVNFLRQNRFKCCNLHDLIYIFPDSGVMNTPKRRFLSFVFTVLCFKKSEIILKCSIVIKDLDLVILILILILFYFFKCVFTQG